MAAHQYEPELGNASLEPMVQTPGCSAQNSRDLVCLKKPQHLYHRQVSTFSELLALLLMLSTLDFRFEQRLHLLPLQVL